MDRGYCCMKHGYYWLQLEGEEPEVVEIDLDTMYRCGSDVICVLVHGKWIDRNGILDVVSITGPLEFDNG